MNNYLNTRFLYFVKYIKTLLLILIVLLMFSCQNKTQTNIDSFKKGNFKTVLNDRNITSFAIRNDSLQIETFDNKKDTFYIKWKNDFEYILLKKNPKDLLDSTPFYVKINGIKKNSYTFKAYHKGSNFKQEGTAYKIE